jgi:5-methylcytosine-specific restriction endonuclease McrA
MPSEVLKSKPWNKGKKMSKEFRDKISKAQKGKKHTEETKRKMSQAQKGKKRPPFSEEWKEKINLALRRQWAMGKRKSGRIGKSCSLKQKKEISQAIRGNKHYNWKGGRTSLRKIIRRCYKYRLWRSDIFTRDDFTCQFCGIRGGNLEVDHYPKLFATILDEYKIKTLEQALECEEFWNINNGRTLCRKCHDKTKKGTYRILRAETEKRSKPDNTGYNPSIIYNPNK